MNNECIVSWIDLEGNEYFNEFLPFNEAVSLFYSICENEENKVDYNQIESYLYSEDKVILKYDYKTNKYYC